MVDYDLDCLASDRCTPGSRTVPYLPEVARNRTGIALGTAWSVCESADSLETVWEGLAGTEYKYYTPFLVNYKSF